MAYEKLRKSRIKLFHNTDTVNIFTLIKSTVYEIIIMGEMIIKLV